jgi:hypothetical protein
MTETLVLKEAHAHSIHNRAELRQSTSAGCFYCLATYPATSIRDWADPEDDTALCPRCGIDSVLGDTTGLPVADRGFLSEMKEIWFVGKSQKLLTLYRPVGRAEIDLIEKSGFTAFPPRLPEQPIFYPVTNEEYATEIARDWNTKHATGEGFVTAFQVDAEYASRFERHIVGSRVHEELWVPAEELAEFNRHIVGAISVTAIFRGNGDATIHPERELNWSGHALGRANGSQSGGEG